MSAVDVVLPLASCNLTSCIASAANNNLTSNILAAAATPASLAFQTANSPYDFLDEEVGWFFYKDEFRILQPIWKFCFAFMGRGVIEHPMSVALFPVIFYFACITPLTICDLWGQDWKWVQKYKIQNHKKVTPKIVLKAIKLTFWNHVLLFSPVFLLQYITNQPEIHAPPTAPSLFEFVGQIFIMLNLFDFQYFVWHYMHHRSRRLYKWSHIIHHEFQSPSACSTQYLHPWEVFCVGVYNGVLNELFNAHWMTKLGMSFFNIWISVLAHSGYDFPFDVNHWIPWIMGGCRKHDMHHLKPYTNFQPFFSTFDRLIGTECPGYLAGMEKPQDLVEWEDRREKKVSSWYVNFPEKSVEDD